MSAPTQNYLIVGAGLAGCLLAWRLQQAGQNTTLIGDSTAPSASAVAAGVINPVTGRWSVKSWNIDQLLPTARELYHQLEATLQIQAYHPVPIRRYCQNAEDVKRIQRRIRNPRYADVLGPFLDPNSPPTDIHDPHGSYQIQQAAYVDLPHLLKALRKHFQQTAHYHDQHFDHAALQPNKQTPHWTYKGQNYTHIIFCEGHAVNQNPWFHTLTMKPAKGETLILHAPTLQLPKAIYHHRKWFLPYGDATLRIGATYDDQSTDPTPTPAGAQQLLDGLQAAIGPQHPLKTLQHLAGIRPISTDTKPILGQHPQHPALYLFNGLGSKGASTAPRMSEILCQHLIAQEPIPPEVDLARFSS